jgi:hypothetical protein
LKHIGIPSWVSEVCVALSSQHLSWFNEKVLYFEIGFA